MKKIIFLFIILSVVSYSFAQQTRIEVKTITKVYPLIQSMTKKLNGTFNTALGGQNKTIIAITLPSWTVEWHYSFTSRRDGSTAQNFQLFSGITNLLNSIVPGAGLFKRFTNTALNSLIIPTGSIAVDVFVLDAYNANLFINNQPFTYISSCSVTSATQALMTERIITQGSYFLGIQNSNLRSAALVDIEAVAIQSFVSRQRVPN